VFLGGTTAPGVSPPYYDASDGQVHQLQGLPGDATSVSLFAAAGSDDVYFNVHRALGEDGLYSCPATANQCQRVAGYQADTPIVFSPTFASDQTYFSAIGFALRIGSIAGASPIDVALPRGVILAVLPASDYARSRVIDIVLRADDRALQALQIVGTAVEDWAVSLPPSIDPSTMTRLPDGHVMAGLLDTATQGTDSGGGAVCLGEDGVAWSTGAC